MKYPGTFILFEMRTHPSAEEEIRLVFGQLGEMVIRRYPNLFGDFTSEMIDGHIWYKSPNSKV